METFSMLVALCEGIPFTKVSDTGALLFSLMCAWTNIWTNNRDASDLRHCDITVMKKSVKPIFTKLPILIQFSKIGINFASTRGH